MSCLAEHLWVARSSGRAVMDFVKSLLSSPNLARFPVLLWLVRRTHSPIFIESHRMIFARDKQRTRPSGLLETGSIPVLAGAWNLSWQRHWKEWGHQVGNRSIEGAVVFKGPVLEDFPESLRESLTVRFCTFLQKASCPVDRTVFVGTKCGVRGFLCHDLVLSVRGKCFQQLGDTSSVFLLLPIGGWWEEEEEEG